MEQVLTNLLAIMQQCYGTEHYYKNNYLSFKYTDGVQTFCNKAKAYWLLDIVESLVKTEPKMLDGIISISLMVNDDETAYITFSKDDEIIYKQFIPYTDCPKGEWRFYYQNNVFMWCDEY